MTEPLSYASAGVDVEAGERAVDLMRAAIARTDRPEVVGNFGGFAGLFDVSAVKSMAKPLLATSTDGVGTKIDVAARMNIHDTVGIDLVAMVVDDLVVCGAEPLFMTDYIAVGKVNPERVAAIVTGIATGCELAGCALVGGETAEHPGLLGPDEYDIAGAGTGVVDAENLLGAHKVQVGDAAIAIEASGLHSNGFSLARHIAFNLAHLDVHNHISEFGRTLGEELLEPTRIYTKDLLALIKSVEVHSISHITGGGISANVARVMPQNLALEIDRSTWMPLPVFNFLQMRGNLAQLEAEKTFNMGIGMLAFVAVADADKSIALLAQRGLVAWQVGSVRERTAEDISDSLAKGTAGGVVNLVGNYRI
ncbi:MAG: phosphoribosylformylglycinamidine cyclo-ligase [Actinobacteria bacterium]|nr:phosphoribosylformylglycinamidine cyclo-ligase [Actinomycetota bacterium]NBY15558.1 phosphoribosylformylglycinamidine cyclo-ligase [Actinomycetota bacterium]